MFFTILGWIGLFFGGFLLGILFIVLIKVRETRRKIASNISNKRNLLQYYNTTKQYINY